ncbi:MAG: histidine kinase [Bacteroidales bacterium]|nr:histidine kinase [Bacteroidales bacterium]
MEKLNSENFIDQGRPFAHIFITVISLLTVLWLALKSQSGESFFSLAGIFLLMLILIETFIYIGRVIFVELKPGINRKEFTRIVLIRLVLFIFVCFTAALIIFLVYRHLVTWITGGNMSEVISNFFNVEFRSWYKSTISGLGIGAVIFLIIQWQDALKREQKLKEESLIFQNETLKNQINPHFLFNSLNTLSALITKNPETAERFLTKFASIYRYILENSSKEKVSLENELAFINDYFFLQKIRDEDKIIMEVTLSETGKYDIIPVSLQILVENALKHNMATHEKPLRINIYDEADYIVVENNLQKKEIPEKSTRIGLKNLSERVRISTGLNLIINQTADKFQVKIPLLP